MNDIMIVLQMIYHFWFLNEKIDTFFIYLLTMLLLRDKIRYMSCQSEFAKTFFDSYPRRSFLYFSINKQTSRMMTG